MIRTLFCLIFLICNGLYAAHWNEEQVVDYVHHSELQRRSTWHLLSQIKFSGNEKVLDVGCGDGRNTAWIAWLVRQGSIIGIDPSEAMLDWAKKQYHPFEFPNLSFLSGDACTLPEEMFDVITAFFSLHMVQDKQLAIQGFFEHLNTGGYVIATLPPGSKNPDFLDAVSETMSHARWEPYFQSFQMNFRFEPLQAYADYFEKSGFSLLHVKDIDSVDPFVNREEAINWFKGTWPHIHYLPQELRTPFISEIIDRYLQKRPSARALDGSLHFYWGHFEIIAQKT